MSELGISVVIATRNRASRLDTALASLARMAPPEVEWELLVVDNGSLDRTRAIVDKYRSLLPVVYLHESVPGMNRARNRGIEAARGELVVFTDDDVRVHEAWLAAVWRGVARWPQDAIFGGLIEPSLPPSTPHWVASRDFFFRGYAFADYRLEAREGPVSVPPYGPNFAVRRALLRERLFDPAIGPNGQASFAMGAETEFLLWAKRAGSRFIYLPEARVAHVIPEPQVRKRHLLQRAFNAGRSWERLNLDVEIAGRECAADTAGLRRDLRRYRLKRFERLFANRKRRFRNEVKIKMIEGRLHERFAADQAVRVPSASSVVDHAIDSLTGLWPRRSR